MSRLFTNFFDEFKGTDQYKDSVIDTFREFRIVQESAVYVSKAGSDDFDGCCPNNPKSTINSALTVAQERLDEGANAVRIEIMDAGLYEENIDIPSRVVVFGIGATLKGTAIVTGGSELYLDRHLSSANDQSMVEMNVDDPGQALYQTNVTDSREHTGVNVISNTGGGGKNLFIEVGLMFVGENGVGVTDRTSGAGHIHFNIKDLYLAGNGAVGLRSGQAGQNSTNIIGFIDHILQIGGATGTTGILVTHSNARVNAIMGEIIADVAYNVTDGELFLIAPRIVGTRTGTPTFELSQHTFPLT